MGFSHGVKEYQGRWYPEFRIYKFEKKVAAQPQHTIKVEEPAAPAPAPQPQQQQKADDLPF